MFSLAAYFSELNRHATMLPIAKATIATPVSFGVFIRPGLLLNVGGCKAYGSFWTRRVFAICVSAAGVRGLRITVAEIKPGSWPQALTLFDRG
jgi:hypothetical protein